MSFSAANKFLEKLKNLEKFERTDVVIKCETKDTKSPGSWTKNGRAITSLPGLWFLNHERICFQ